LRRFGRGPFERNLRKRGLARLGAEPQYNFIPATGGRQGQSRPTLPG